MIYGTFISCWWYCGHKVRPCSNHCTTCVHNSGLMDFELPWLSRPGITWRWILCNDTNVITIACRNCFYISTTCHNMEKYSYIMALLSLCVWCICQGIEKEVAQCEACQTFRANPAPTPSIPWKFPAATWERVHVDFFSLNGQEFLILIDSHSEWIEVKLNSSTTSAKTIEVLRGIFTSYGLPKELVSDNGPQLASSEFLFGWLETTCIVRWPK